MLVVPVMDLFLLTNSGGGIHSITIIFMNMHSSYRS